jgi:membrane-bound serine protease (ClpP class)
MKNIRLIWAIITNILEEAAIAAIVLWGLPRLGVNLPLWSMIVLMLAWLAFSTFTYHKGSYALMLKPVAGLTSMTGGRGKAVNALALDGMVRIRGELWNARSVSGRVEIGEEVEVVGQGGLKLLVRKLERMSK